MSGKTIAVQTKSTKACRGPHRNVARGQRWRSHRMWSAALALVFLLTGSFARAQERFDSWTTENGLPQNSVADIVQTRDGYLWLATFGGLVRFDGIRFVIFDRSTPGIESQRVRALYQDRSGVLWAG